MKPKQVWAIRGRLRLAHRLRAAYCPTGRSRTGKIRQKRPGRRRSRSGRLTQTCVDARRHRVYPRPQNSRQDRVRLADPDRNRPLARRADCLLMNVTAGHGVRGSAMSNSASWICPSCKVTVVTSFCARCGEEPLSPRDLTLRGLIEKVIYGLTSIDARAARSARELLRRPGHLTLAWTEGVRKPFVAPFQLFLIANVLLFALQWLTGDNVFSSSLDSHLHQQDWSGLARGLLSCASPVHDSRGLLTSPVYVSAVDFLGCIAGGQVQRHSRVWWPR